MHTFIVTGNGDFYYSSKPLPLVIEREETAVVCKQKEQDVRRAYQEVVLNIHKLFEDIFCHSISIAGFSLYEKKRDLIYTQKNSLAVVDVSNSMPFKIILLRSKPKIQSIHLTNDFSKCRRDGDIGLLFDRSSDFNSRPGPTTSHGLDLLLGTFKSLGNDPEIQSILSLFNLDVFNDNTNLRDRLVNLIEKSNVPCLDFIDPSIAQLFDEENVETWIIGMACFLHCCRQKDHSAIKEVSFAGEAEILSTTGRYLAHIIGFPSLGILFHLVALCFRKEESNVKAKHYNDIGMCLRDSGHYQKALEFFAKAAKMEENSDNSRSLTNIGMILNDLGNYQKSKEFAKKALKIQKKCYKSFKKDGIVQHPIIARSYQILGTSYQGLDNDQKALRYMERAKEVRERCFGTKNPFVGISYIDYGMHLRERGRYDEAMQHLRKGLMILESLLGKDHPLVATSYNNIGLCAMDLNEYVTARICLNKALKIRSEILEENHPDFYSSYMNFGKYYLEDTKIDEDNDESYLQALEYFKKALSVFLKSYNKDHPEIIMCHRNIAFALRLLNRYDEAKDYMAENCKI